MRLGPAVVVAAVLASTPASANEGDRWDAKTVAAQGGLGLVGGVAGGLGGMTIGALGGLLIQGKGDWSPTFVGAALIGGIGALVGTVYAVGYAGDALDGTGSTAGTTLGTLTGVAVATGVEVVLRRRHVKGRIPLRLAAIATAIVGGAVIGYQLSGDGTPAMKPIVGGVF